MQLTIVSSGNIHRILEPLEVLVIGHICLPEIVKVGLGLIEGQGKELLIFKSESHCLDEIDKCYGILFLTYDAPVSLLLLEFALQQSSTLSNDK